MAKYNAVIGWRFNFQIFLLVCSLATIGLSSTLFYYGPRYNKTVRALSLTEQPWTAPPGISEEGYTNWTKTLRFPPNLDLDNAGRRSGMVQLVGSASDGTQQRIKIMPWWGSILVVTSSGLSICFMIAEWIMLCCLAKKKKATEDVSDAVNQAERNLDRTRACFDLSAFINWCIAIPYFAGWFGWYGSFVCKGNTVAFCDYTRGAFSVAVVAFVSAGCAMYTSYKLGTLKGLTLREMYIKPPCHNCNVPQQPIERRAGPVTGMVGGDTQEAPPPAYNKEMEASAEIKYEK